MNAVRYPSLPPLAIGLLAVAVVLLDPAVSDMLPAKLWRFLRLENSPVRSTLLVLAALVPMAALVGSLYRSAVPTYLFLLFAAAQMNGVRFGPIDALDVVLLAGVLAGGASLTQARAPRFVVSPIALVALFLLMLALPHLIVQSPVRMIIGTISLVRVVLITLLLVSILADRRNLDTAIAALIIIATISAALAILQFALGYLAGKYFTLIDPPETAFKPTPIGFVMRASGLCITAQHLSGFLATALPFALWRLTSAWRVRDVVVVGIIGLGVLLSWNFSAILAVAVVLALFPLLRWPSQGIQIALLYALFAVAAYYAGVFEYIYEKIVSDAGAGRGVSQRETLNLLAIEKLDRSLLIGTGPQGFGEFTGNFWRRPVHNMLLQTTAELGLLGTLALIAGILYLTGALLAGMFDGTREQSALSRVALLALLTNLGLSMSEPMMDHSNLWMFLALIQAIVLRPSQPADQ